MVGPSLVTSPTQKTDMTLLSLHKYTQATEQHQLIGPWFSEQMTGQSESAGRPAGEQQL